MDFSLKIYITSYYWYSDAIHDDIHIEEAMPFFEPVLFIITTVSEVYLT